MPSEVQLHQDTILIIRGRAFQISHHELVDRSHVLSITQDEKLILSDTSDYFQQFEILDFDQDQFPDVRINFMSNVDFQSLYLYQPQSEQYVKVRDFERYPQAKALQTVFGEYYYSYRRGGCADNYWTSYLFQLKDSYVVLIGRMNGNQCDQPYTVKLYRLNGEAEELRKTLPYDENKDKWKFINQSWQKHYKRVFPDTLTVDQFIKFFNHPNPKDYDVARDLSKYLADRTTQPEFWSNKQLLAGDTLKPFPIWGYPLSYKAVNKTVKRVTVFNETNTGYEVTVFTLDKYYNVIASESLTRYEGDQGDQYKSLGYFINDSTYVKTEIITRIDSVYSPEQHYLLFHSNGRIERKDP